VLELASYMACVAVYYRCVSFLDPWVVHDHHLRLEPLRITYRIIISVGSHVSSLDVGGWNSLDAKSDVVARDCFYESLVVHLDALTFCVDIKRTNVNGHAGSQNTRLDSAARY